jgi:hypothetical protein
MNEVVWIIVLGVPVISMWLLVIWGIISNFRKKKTQGISIEDFKQLEPEYHEYGESTSEIDLEDEED